MSRNCGCLVTWFCYQLAKPGNKTATVPWPDPYIVFHWVPPRTCIKCVPSLTHFEQHFIETYRLYWNMNVISNDKLLLSVNSLSPGSIEWNSRQIIFMLILVIGGWAISSEIAIRWISRDLTNNKSTLVQVMAWGRQATSHYLSQCWPNFMSPYGVTRSQWVINALFVSVWLPCGRPAPGVRPPVPSPSGLVSPSSAPGRRPPQPGLRPASRRGQRTICVCVSFVTH